MDDNLKKWAYRKIRCKMTGLISSATINDAEENKSGNGSVRSNADVSCAQAKASAVAKASARVTPRSGRRCCSWSPPPGAPCRHRAWESAPVGWWSSPLWSFAAWFPALSIALWLQRRSPGSGSRRSRNPESARICPLWLIGLFGWGHTWKMYAAIHLQSCGETSRILRGSNSAQGCWAQGHHCLCANLRMCFEPATSMALDRDCHGDHDSATESDYSSLMVDTFFEDSLVLVRSEMASFK